MVNPFTHYQTPGPHLGGRPRPINVIYPKIVHSSNSSKMHVLKAQNRTVSCSRILLRDPSSSHTDRGTELHASLLLRRHFCSRTNELLIPLSRYLNTLIPTPSEVASCSLTRLEGDTDNDKRLKLKPFNSDNFFASLKAYGTTLPFRSNGKRNEFYERWVFHTVLRFSSLRAEFTGG